MLDDVETVEDAGVVLVVPVECVDATVVLLVLPEEVEGPEDAVDPCDVDALAGVADIIDVDAVDEPCDVDAVVP